MEAPAVTQSNKFALKTEYVTLVPRRTSERVELSIDELEALRTDARPVSASKHGLEIICGASCDTAAQ